jgi:hypothetical protein
MPVTGDAIRMMNYVDDIAATLRRIAANIPFMTDEEKKTLAEYMRKSEPNFVAVLERLEKGGPVGV